MSILVAIIGLSILVIFHEFGHFLAAKLCGVGVLEFSVGMGPRLFSHVWHNTRYSLKLLPFGGSCAMLGEDAAGSGDFETASGTEMSDDELDPWIDYDGVRFRKSELKDHSFNEKSAPRRFFICVAGVLNNFILAFLMAAVLVGFTGFDRLYVVGVQEDAPIAVAGLEKGDQVTGIGYTGKHISNMPSYRDLYIWLYVHAREFTSDTELTIRYVRDGETKTLSTKPYYSTENQKYMLGISFYGGRILPGNALAFLQDTWYEFRYNVSMVVQSLRMLAAGQVKRQEVMGPVGAVSVMGETVQESSQYGIFNAFLVFLELLVMLSANLGVMNLLPIPALDGGRLLFILCEMIFRKRLNPELEGKINAVGMAALFALMVVIMGNDIINLVTGAYEEILNG